MFVTATGLSLPDRVPLKPEIAVGRYPQGEADRTQMVEFARDTEGLSSLDYAARASRDAIDATSDYICQDLSALIHCGVSPLGGPPAYNAASKLHQMLGLGPTVMPLGMTNGCTISLAAIENACLRLAGDPRDRQGAVLIAASEVWPRALVNPLTASRGLILADGSAAMMVSNTFGFASILATGSRIDSRMSDATRGAESLAYDPAAKIDLGARFDHYAANVVDAPTHRKMRDDLVRKLVDEVLTDAGLELDQIDAYVLTHSGARNLDAGYFRLLPNAKHRTNTSAIGWHVGHVGSADWLIGLHTLRASGALSPGHRVLMLGGGGGWQESAVVLRML